MKTFYTILPLFNHNLFPKNKSNFTMKTLNEKERIYRKNVFKQVALRSPHTIYLYFEEISSKKNPIPRLLVHGVVKK